MFSYKRPIAIAAAVVYGLIAILIFYFALQPGELSEKVSQAVYAIFNGINIDEERLETDAEKVPIKGILLSAGNVLPFVGEEGYLTIEVLPKNHTEGYSFYSSDEAVVSVNEYGRVKYLSEGKATVSAISSSGGVKADLNIEIFPRSAPENADKSAYKLVIDENAFINAAIRPTVLYGNKEVVDGFTLTSSDAEVALINDGYILTRSAGTATVSVSVGGETVAEASITVGGRTLEEPKIISAFFDESAADENAVLLLGKSSNLKFSLSNVREAVNSYVIKADDLDVYYGDGNGVTITPTALGKNTLKVYSRTSSDTLLMTINYTVERPPATITALIKPENGFSIDNAYTFELDVSDKLGIYGLVPEVTGNDYTVKSESVTFNKVGNYGLKYASANITSDADFKVIVLDRSASSPFRKLVGHFGLFAALGFFGVFGIAYFIKKLRYKLVIVGFSGFLTATISEILQLPIFTVARGFSVADIFIDFGGYLLGAAIAVGFTVLVYRIRSSRRASSSTDK